MITQKKFLIAEQEFERELFGSFDENIKLIEDTLSIDVILREGINGRGKKRRFSV